MQRPVKPKLYEYITSIGSLAVAGLLLASTMITGVKPASPLDALRPRALKSSANEGDQRLGVLVNNTQSTSVQQGGSYTLSFAVAGQPWEEGETLDAKYVLCSIVNSGQCGNSIVGPWGNYRTDSASRIVVDLPNNIPVGYYIAQFRPRGASNWGWSNPISVAVYPTTGSVGEKAALHKFTNLRAGMFRTADGKWNVQDYALHLVNLSNQNVDIYWKLISDDPNFLFTGGTRGVKTRILPTDAWGYQSLNISAPEIYSFEVPTYSNFTGSNELIGCVRGSSPCVPAKFYAYMLPQTPVKVSADANAAWFSSWDEWADAAVPVGFDQDYGLFVIPYTNYWHNLTENGHGVGILRLQ